MTDQYPEIIDTDVLASILARIARADRDVLVPVFDRNAGVVINQSVPADICFTSPNNAIKA